MRTYDGSVEEKQAQQRELGSDPMLAGMLFLGNLFLSVLLLAFFLGVDSERSVMGFAFPMAFYGMICLMVRKHSLLLCSWSVYLIVMLVCAFYISTQGLEAVQLILAVVFAGMTVYQILKGRFPLSRWGKFLVFYLLVLLLTYHTALLLPVDFLTLQG